MSDTIILIGNYGYNSYKFSEKGLDVDMIDASAASWTVANGSDGGSTLNLYPFAVVYANPGLILQGGTINGEISLYADWEDAYVNSAGMRVDNSPGVIIRDWRIDQPWDGIRIAGESTDFVIDNVWISNSRDDAVENDDMNSGTIRNSLFDGVSSGISFGDGSSPDGSDNVVTIDGVLLRSKSFLNEGQMTHGSPIKMEKSIPDITPNLRIHNTVFAIEDVDHNGQTRLQKAWDKTIESSNNYFLNLSDTPLPSDYPKPLAGWTILQGQQARDHWAMARADWIDRHDDENASPSVPSDPSSDPEPGAPTFSGVKFLGSDKAELIVGNELNNNIDGDGGNDRIHGGTGNDILRGDEGTDDLWGGAGNDMFYFKRLSDSNQTYGVDIVRDFARSDKIDLSAIDANERSSGNQAFNIIAGNLGTTPGQLKITYDASESITIVTGSVDRDAEAEFIVNLAGKVDLSASDFML